MRFSKVKISSATLLYIISTIRQTISYRATSSLSRTLSPAVQFLPPPRYPTLIMRPPSTYSLVLSNPCSEGSHFADATTMTITTFPDPSRTYNFCAPKHAIDQSEDSPAICRIMAPPRSSESASRGRIRNS